MRGFVIIFRFKEYINLYIFINGFFMLSKKIIIENNKKFNVKLVL